MGKRFDESTYVGSSRRRYGPPDPKLFMPSNSREDWPLPEEVQRLDEENTLRCTKHFRVLIYDYLENEQCLFKIAQTSYFGGLAGLMIAGFKACAIPEYPDATVMHGIMKDLPLVAKYGVLGAIYPMSLCFFSEYIGNNNTTNYAMASLVTGLMNGYFKQSLGYGFKSAAVIGAVSCTVHYCVQHGYKTFDIDTTPPYRWDMEGHRRKYFLSGDPNTMLEGKKAQKLP